jgi:hypothetical protein
MADSDCRPLVSCGVAVGDWNSPDGIGLHGNGSRGAKWIGKDRMGLGWQ